MFVRICSNCTFLKGRTETERKPVTGHTSQSRAFICGKEIILLLITDRESKCSLSIFVQKKKRGFIHDKKNSGYIGAGRPDGT